MAVIKTKRNFVAAYEPLEGDCFVEAWLTGENRHLLLTQTIDQYRAAVDWAVGMADQMAWPLEVVTITRAEYLHRNRDTICAALAAMTDQERGELRQLVVKACAQMLRDCEDSGVRADAYDVLVKMKVVKQ